MLNFQDLPDELILKILSYAETKDLINCGQVSKKIRRISQDATLWETANLEKKIVNTELIQMILRKGCRVLNLHQSTILGSLSSISRSGLRRGLLIPKSQLRVLKLSRPECNTNCNCDSDTDNYKLITDSDTDTSLTNTSRDDCDENTDVLEDLLFSCSSLQQLEIKDVLLTNEMAESICKNGKTLQILNLNSSDLFFSEYSEGSEDSEESEDLEDSEDSEDWEDYNYLQEIFKCCQELKEVGLANVNYGNGITEDDDLEFLFKNIPPNVEKLNLRGTLISDNQVETLLNRCNKIKTLSLEATWITDDSFSSIRQCLNHTLEELSLGPFDEISDPGFLELKSMPRLKILKLYYKGKYYNKDDGEVIQRNLRQ